MDLNTIKDAVSSLTLYDLKAGVRKVQNAVMNYTEMESKVREATNNEPWGASSSLMQDIANGTFSYQTLNEIMPMIYRRFTEKAAEEWRQIYKALQLLEFLIKNGSERVIDDARSHLTLLKMLRQFHFIDQNGKDQGVNVRNRAKELAELLSDVERIRAERRKARDNKAKYVGVEGGASRYGGFSSSSMAGPAAGFSSSGGRFGGFGSDTAGFGANTSSYGGYSGGVYGDGGGFGGQEPGEFRDSSQARHLKFEEYDEDDDGDRAGRSSRPTSTMRSTSDRAGVKKTTEPAPKKKEPEVDLFDFDEPAPSSSGTGLTSLVASSGTTAATTAGGDDDEFDDFQSAPATMQTSTALPAASSFAPIAPPPSSNATQFVSPKPVSAPQQANLSQMVGLSSISPAPATNSAGFGGSAFAAPAKPAVPMGFQAATPNYFSSVPLQAAASSPAVMSSSTGPVGTGAKPMAPPSSSAAPKAAAGGDAFGALWSQASVGIKKASTPTAGPSMGSLAKAKSSAGIWGAPATTGAAIDTPSSSTTSKPTAPGSSNGLDDLLG